MLYITVGIPRSGKSMWANECSINYPNTYVIERDIIRTTFFTESGNRIDYRYSNQKEKLVTLEQHTRVRTLLREGNTVIVSDTNLNPITRQSIIDIAVSEGVPYELAPFHTTFYECMRRNEKSGNDRVPDSVMIRMEKAKRVYDGRYVKPEFDHGGKHKCIIVDIDGTLAIHKGVRGPHEEDKVSLDLPRQFVIDFVNMWFNRNYLYGRAFGSVILMSGRHETCRKNTELWLDKHNVSYNKLIMRGAEDNRNDSVIKSELFDKHIANQYNVEFVIDDRKQVCVMWESMGLDVVNVGGFSSDF
jgi:predicted kinase